MKFKDMPYERVDFEAVEKEMDALTKAFGSAASGEEQFAVPSDWKSYLKLCRLSASDFFTSMVKEVGLMSPFEPGCVKNVVEKLEKYVK